MKLRNNRFTEIPRKTDLVSWEKASGATLLTYAGTAISILGTMAWTAGHSYSTGYWDKAGLPNTYFASTIQETMFSSIHAAESWMSFSLLLIISGMVLFFGSIRRKKPKVLKAKSTSSRWKLDPSMSFVGLSIAAVAYVLLLGILVFAIWFSSAAGEGEKAYEKVVCSIQPPNKLPNAVLMADGTNLHGRVENSKKIHRDKIGSVPIESL